MSERTHDRPEVDVVIVSYNTRDLTLEAVRSAAGQRGVDTNVVVVDNASSDGSPEALRALAPSVRLIELPANVGFGRANNVGIRACRAPYVLLLNSDATFIGEAGLAGLVRTLERHPRAAVVGPRLEDAGGRVEFSARAFPSVAAELVRAGGLHRLLPAERRASLLGGEFVDHTAPRSVDWLTGACLLVRREALDEVGGFDPAIFLYGEELEWCWRLRRAGWSLRFEPSVRVRHLRGASGAGPSGAALRLAMAGDAYAVRRHRGGAYLVAFAAVRMAALAVTGVVQGVLALGGGEDRRARAVHAWRALPAWTAALLRGGATAPWRLAPAGAAADPSSSGAALPRAAPGGER